MSSSCLLALPWSSEDINRPGIPLLPYLSGIAPGLKESYVTSAWSTQAPRQPLGCLLCAPVQETRATAQQTPQPGIPQRTEAACFHVPCTQHSLAGCLPCQPPGPWGRAQKLWPPTSSLLPTSSFWILSAQGQGTTDKLCPWSQRRDSLQLHSNSESWPGRTVLRMWRPEGEFCGHEMSENVL